MAPTFSDVGCAELASSGFGVRARLGGGAAELCNAGRLGRVVGGAAMRSMAGWVSFVVTPGMAGGDFAVAGVTGLGRLLPIHQPANRLETRASATGTSQSGRRRATWECERATSSDSVPAAGSMRSSRSAASSCRANSAVLRGRPAGCFAKQR